MWGRRGMYRYSGTPESMLWFHHLDNYFIYNVWYDLIYPIVTFVQYFRSEWLRNVQLRVQHRTTRACLPKGVSDREDVWRPNFTPQREMLGGLTSLKTFIQHMMQVPNPHYRKNFLTILPLFVCVCVMSSSMPKTWIFISLLNPHPESKQNSIIRSLKIKIALKNSPFQKEIASSNY